MHELEQIKLKAGLVVFYTVQPGPRQLPGADTGQHQTRNHADSFQNTHSIEEEARFTLASIPLQ